jgi:hypothetical protein
VGEPEGLRGVRKKLRLRIVHGIDRCEQMLACPCCDQVTAAIPTSDRVLAIVRCPQCGYSEIGR